VAAAAAGVSGVEGNGGNTAPNALPDANMCEENAVHLSGAGAGNCEGNLKRPSSSVAAANAGRKWCKNKGMSFFSSWSGKWLRIA
jgi:hypothetical protein